ncbi:hypothetical protein D3C76_1815360 [compost metagenome]
MDMSYQFHQFQCRSQTLPLPVDDVLIKDQIFQRFPLDIIGYQPVGAFVLKIITALGNVGMIHGPQDITFLA